MFRSTLLLVTITLVSANFQSEFNSFKAQHAKKYAHPKEEAHRYQVFSTNLKRINEHNERFERGLETYQMGVNAYTDLTFAEFSETFLGLDLTGKSPAPLLHNINSTDDLPENVDLREKGIVNPIKDQGQCGSCWAFSATASIEGAKALATGKLVSLSEQNLMDCSYKEGDNACNGGLPDKAFTYVMDAGGIDTEDSYPYKAASSKTCLFSKDKVGATISKFVDISSGDESALKNAAAERVVSVAIHVGDDFQHYKTGIFDQRFCPSWTLFLNHAVNVIGYGSDHWLVRNSWGTSWGEEGYVRFAIGKNLCGIATAASYPLV